MPPISLLTQNLTLDDLIKMGKITTKTIDRVNIVKSYIEKNSFKWKIDKD